MKLITQKMNEIIYTCSSRSYYRNQKEITIKRLKEDGFLFVSISPINISLFKPKSGLDRGEHIELYSDNKVNYYRINCCEYLCRCGILTGSYSHFRYCFMDELFEKILENKDIEIPRLSMSIVPESMPYKYEEGAKINICMMGGKFEKIYFSNSAESPFTEPRVEVLAAKFEDIRRLIELPPELNNIVKEYFEDIRINQLLYILNLS